MASMESPKIGIHCLSARIRVDIVVVQDKETGMLFSLPEQRGAENVANSTQP